MWPLLLLAGISSASPADKSTVIPRPPEQLAIAAEAERLGRDIYDFDQAAWGATDAMAAAMHDYAAAGVKGWIVEREPTGAVAIFYGQDKAQPYKIFVAHMQGQKVVSSHIVAAGEDRNLTPIEQRMVAARTIALRRETLDWLQKQDFHPCTSGSINTVVLPPATPEAPVPVYLLTPQASLSSFPIGGHFRIDVAADGSIVRSRAFAKSCIVLDPRQVPADARMFLVSHLLDQQPTEIHVWVALASHVPLGVLIAPHGDIWTVADGKVRYMSTLPASSLAK